MWQLLNSYLLSKFVKYSLWSLNVSWSYNDGFTIASQASIKCDSSSRAHMAISKSGDFILREMCPNTEFFLVRMFPHSDWIRRDTRDLSVFSPNAETYGPEKTLYLDTFHAVECWRYHYHCIYHKDACYYNFVNIAFFEVKFLIFFYFTFPN